ncbi:MAG: hypothetical protein ACC742_00485 [Thermoanaerobaculales bacterium]
MKPNPTGMPGDWDALRDRVPEPDRQPAVPAADERGSQPPPVALMAAAWADLVGILGVCTGALLALLALGERPALVVFPWAAALALVWWGFAAAVLVVVRQGTPGMLLAGVVFKHQVSRSRVPWVLVAALFQIASLGLAGFFGARYSPLRVAAASPLVVSGDGGVY